MKACVLTTTGGPGALAIAAVPDAPPPGAGEVRVALRAAALNHLDLFVTEGVAGVEYAFPKIVGADGAGLVESVGAGVTHVLLTGPRSDAAPTLNQLLARPGYLRLVHVWPGSVLAFAVDRPGTPGAPAGGATK